MYGWHRRSPFLKAFEKLLFFHFFFILFGIECYKQHLITKTSGYVCMDLTLSSVVLILVSRHQPHIPASPWGGGVTTKKLSGGTGRRKGGPSLKLGSVVIHSNRIKSNHEPFSCDGLSHTHTAKLVESSETLIS